MISKLLVVDNGVMFTIGLLGCITLIRSRLVSFSTFTKRPPRWAYSQSNTLDGLVAWMWATTMMQSATDQLGTAKSSPTAKLRPAWNWYQRFDTRAMWSTRRPNVWTEISPICSSRFGRIQNSKSNLMSRIHTHTPSLQQAPFPQNRSKLKSASQSNSAEFILIFGT